MTIQWRGDGAFRVAFVGPFNLTLWETGDRWRWTVRDGWGVVRANVCDTMEQARSECEAAVREVVKP